MLCSPAGSSLCLNVWFVRRPLSHLLHYNKENNTNQTTPLYSISDDGDRYLNYISCKTPSDESDRCCHKCRCSLITGIRGRFKLWCVSSQGHRVMTTPLRFYEWSWCDDDSASGCVCVGWGWGVKKKTAGECVDAFHKKLNVSSSHCKSLFTCLTVLL